MNSKNNVNGGIEMKAGTFSVRVARLNGVMRNVYMWMTGGLTVSGVVALFFGSNEQLVRAIASNPVLFFGLIIGEFILIITLIRRIGTMSIGAAIGSFIGYAVLNGVTLSVIFLAYTTASIATTFFIAAGTFAAMSIWAMNTSRNLQSWGRYLFFGLIGLIIASLVNFLLRSEAIDYIISFVGVALFLGLTAYDTQQIYRMTESMGAHPDESAYMRVSILGALKLYLDFINLFLFLLRIFGRRR